MCPFQAFGHDSAPQDLLPKLSWRALQPTEVHQDGTRAASRRVDDQPERLAIDGSVAAIDLFGVEDEIGTPHHGRLAEDERRVDFAAKALRNDARELASPYDAPTDPGQTAFELLSLPGREIDPTHLHAPSFLKIKVILGSRAEFPCTCSTAPAPVAMFQETHFSIPTQARYHFGWVALEKPEISHLLGIRGDGLQSNWQTSRHSFCKRK